MSTADPTAAIIGERKGNLEKDVIYEFQLEEAREKILREKLDNWAELEENGFTIGLSEQDTGLLAEFDTNENEMDFRRTMINDMKDGKCNGNCLAKLFLDLVAKVSNAKVKIYFLAQIDRLLCEDIGLAKFFTQCDDPYQPFIRCPDNLEL